MKIIAEKYSILVNINLYTSFTFSGQLIEVNPLVSRKANKFSRDFRFSDHLKDQSQPRPNAGFYGYGNLSKGGGAIQFISKKSKKIGYGYQLYDHGA
jgi:hypothetical protein